MFVETQIAKGFLLFLYSQVETLPVLNTTDRINYACALYVYVWKPVKIRIPFGVSNSQKEIHIYCCLLYTSRCV